MIKGIFTSGSGMHPRMLRLQVIANNLANINTTGFKRDSMFIQALKKTGLIQQQNDGDLAGLDVRQFTDFSEGSLAPTNNPFDVAIQGRGFFVVETPQGMQYTRNGNFMLSADGSLVTSQGYPVLGVGGRIQFPDIRKLAQGNVAITATGEIFADNSLIGKLRVVDFERASDLRKQGNTLFSTSAKELFTEADGKTTAIKQGFLEESNVDGIEEMIEMIELNRSFESDQKSIQYQDSTLEKAMDVGRV